MKPAILLASLLALVGCAAVGPKYEIPSAAALKRPTASEPFMGATTEVFSTGTLPSGWWRLYHDATLNALIEKAFAANTDLRVASANLVRARAALGEVQASERPVVDISAAPAYGRASAAARGDPDASPDIGSYDAGFSISYQADLIGKIARAVDAASADVEATWAAYDLTRITVAAETTRAYAVICSTGKQLGVTRRLVDLQERFLSLTTQRARAGRGTALDISRARAQLEQLRAALPPLQAQQRVAQYRLAVLTGQLPGDTSVAAAQCEKALQIARPIPVGNGADLLRRRPDIRQAERALAGASARIGVATADLYPSISLGVSTGSSGVLSEFGTSNALRWSIGPLISWTLPSTGAARSRIAQAQASSDAALARFDAAVLNALREAESALVVYARELDRNAALKDARQQSLLASNQADLLYHYGRTDFLSALDTRRTLANAESALAASEAQLAEAQITLFLALGGGWESAGEQLDSK